MKKIIDHYGFFLEPLVVITALVLAMFSQDGKHVMLQWSSLSFLWGLVLWQLRQPNQVYEILKDKAFLGYSLFLGWAIFSSFFLSNAKSVSIIMLIPFMGGLLSYFIGYTSNKDKSLFFYRMLLALGLLLVVYTCYQAFILDIKRPSGTLVNWNTHAAFLAMIVSPWLLRHCLKQVVSSSQVFYWSVVSFLFAFAMGLTLSRGALLILATVMFFFILFAWKQRLFFKHSVFFLLSLVLGYFLSGLIISESVIQRFNIVSESEILTTFGSGRDLLWGPAWQMYLDRPLLGWGLGVFVLLYKQYKDPLSIELGYFTHNDYLQFLLELGPIGLLIFLGFIFVLFSRLCSLVLRVYPNLSTHKTEAFVLLTTSIGMLAHTFFTFHLYQLTIQIVWGYYLGQATKNLNIDLNVSSYSAKVQNNQSYTWTYRIFCSLVMLSIVTFGLSFYYMNKAGSAQDQKTVLDSYSKVEIFFPLLSNYHSVSANYLTEKLKQFPVNEETLVQRKQISALALNEVNSAIQKMPLNSINYITKAEVMRMMQGDRSIVSEQYEKALKIDPYQLKVRDAYAQYLVEKKQYSQALITLWDGWGRINLDYYRNGIVFLKHHLEINELYGNPVENSIIEGEISRLTELENVKVVGGKFIFQKIKNATYN